MEPGYKVDTPGILVKILTVSRESFDPPLSVSKSKLVSTDLHYGEYIKRLIPDRDIPCTGRYRFVQEYFTCIGNPPLYVPTHMII